MMIYLHQCRARDGMRLYPQGLKHHSVVSLDRVLRDSEGWKRLEIRHSETTQPYVQVFVPS